MGISELEDRVGEEETGTFLSMRHCFWFVLRAVRVTVEVRPQ